MICVTHPVPALRQDLTALQGFGDILHPVHGNAGKTHLNESILCSGLQRKLPYHISAPSQIEVKQCCHGITGTECRDDQTDVAAGTQQYGGQDKEHWEEICNAADNGSVAFKAIIGTLCGFE